MGIYLDALRKNKKAGAPTLRNLNNPLEGSSLGSLGTPPPHLEIIHTETRPAIDVKALLVEACRGVAGVTPDQYLALLSADDIAGIQCGETGLEILRAYAPHFAEGLVSGRLAVPEPIGPVHVRCGQCTHFVRDPVNPPAGIGTCAVAGEGAADFVLYPCKPRVCGDFAAAETPGPQP